MKWIYTANLYLCALLVPFIASAQTTATNPVFGDLADTADTTVNILQTVLIILTILVTAYFIWMVIKYLRDPTAEHLSRLLMASIGIAVFALIWGIVAFLGGAVGVGDDEEAGRLIAPGLEQGIFN